MRLFSFPEIPENAVSFPTGNFRKCTPEFLVEWKIPEEEETPGEERQSEPLIQTADSISLGN